MSHMVSEKSPRALLAMAEELHDHLNELRQETAIEASDGSRSTPGFILKRVELIFLEIRTCLDCAPTQASEAPDPLMLRLREHIDSISSVLTGTGVQFQSEDTTTLQELIQAVSRLNKSVCSTQTGQFCTVS